MKGKSTDQNKKEYMLEQQKYAGKNTDLVQAFFKQVELQNIFHQKYKYSKY